jgi:hypothetical protein
MPTRTPRPEPVQRFKPTSGAVIGYGGLVATVAVAVLVAVEDRHVSGVRVVCLLGALAVLIWAALLRQRATAYRETLLLRHMFSDTELPLARIDGVLVRNTLNIWIGETRYICAGIGRSTRQMTRRRSRGALSAIGLQQADDRMAVTQAGEIGTGSDYPTFVETRIEDLAKSARRDLRGEPPPVRRLWAIPELAALGLFLAGFLLTFVVG